jgi:hypothetical protein
MYEDLNEDLQHTGCIQCWSFSVSDVSLDVISDKDDEYDEKSSSSKPPVDIVSAAIMAKVLEERERERLNVKHCDSCTCPRQAVVHCSTQATLVMDQGILCVRCAASVRFVVIIL